MLSPEEFKIRADYVQRDRVKYDNKAVFLGENDTVWQPHVYDIAVQFARKFNCSEIIDFGCGNAHKLSSYFKEFKITGVDYGENINFCKKNYPNGTWIEHDLEQPLELKTDGNAVIICADIIEHLKNPNILLVQTLKKLKYKVLLLSTPNRRLSNAGPPQKEHIREWNICELRDYLRKIFRIVWVGTTKSNSNTNSEWKTSLVVSTDKDTQIPDIPENWGKLGSFLKKEIPDAVFPYFNKRK